MEKLLRVLGGLVISRVAQLQARKYAACSQPEGVRGKIRANAVFRLKKNFE